LLTRTSIRACSFRDRLLAASVVLQQSLDRVVSAGVTSGLPGRATFAAAGGGDHQRKRRPG